MQLDQHPTQQAQQHQGESRGSTAAAAVGSNLSFVVSASLDSSLCLWSSAGALVGVFGRHSWALDDISSWQSSTRALLKVRAGGVYAAASCSASSRQQLYGTTAYTVKWVGCCRSMCCQCLFRL
jgi:hypothetical protein